ncbi:MAG: DNA repair protein RecO [bacterium]|nr:DNA repair protein RecO [bacterium]
MNQKTRAILLRSYKYGESSRVAVFLTPGSGKIKGVLKGVEKTKSRYSKLRFFGLYDAEFRRIKGRELDVVASLEIVDDFAGIVKKSESYAVAVTIIEITTLITNFENEEIFLFGELCFVLDMLSRSGAGENPVRYLIIYILRSMYRGGFIGGFSECNVCGNKLGPFFVISSGETRCKKCVTSGKKIFIERVLASKIDGIMRGKMSEHTYLSVGNAELRKISPVTRLLLDFVLSKPLKSLDFLSSVLKKREKSSKKINTESVSL